MKILILSRSTALAALVVALGMATPTAAKVSAYDNNGDGLVDRSEFDAGVTAHTGFGVYDQDRDGRWSQDEFRQRFNNNSGEFEQFDTNRDGFLSKDEFHGGVYGRFDANGDGKLDTKESQSFDRAVGIYFDTNYDNPADHETIIEDETKLDIKAR